MFKLNIVGNANVVSIYMLGSFSLWHYRLSHVYVRKMHNMIGLDLIPNIENDMIEKCHVCMKTKTIRKLFQKSELTSSLLELIHSDVCDLHSTRTRGG